MIVPRSMAQCTCWPGSSFPLFVSFVVICTAVLPLLYYHITGVIPGARTRWSMMHSFVFQISSLHLPTLAAAELELETIAFQ